MAARRILIALLSFAFLFGVYYTFVNTPYTQFLNSVENCDEHIANFENSFEKTYTSIEETGSTNFALNQKLNYSLFIFENDTLTFWNDNHVNPNNIKDEIEEDGSFISYKSGFYFAFKKTIQNKEYIALQLFKTNFSTENKYLTNEYQHPYTFSSATEIQDNDIENGMPISTQNGKKLLQVTFSESTISKAKNPALTISYISLFILLCINTIVSFHLKEKWGYWAGLITACLFFLLYKYGLPLIPFEFFKTPLFKPEIYASLHFGSSLGQIGIYSISILLISYYFYHSIICLKFSFNKWYIALSVCVYTSTVFYIAMTAIKSLVLDSTLSFDVSNFTNIDINTFFSLLIIINILSTVYIILLSSIYILKKQKYSILYFLSIALICPIALCYANFQHSIISIFISLTLFFLLFYIIQAKGLKISSYSNFIIAVVFASIQGTIIVKHFYNEKKNSEKEIIASQLDRQRDFVAEYNFDEVTQKLQEDYFIVSYFVNPLASLSELNQRISHIYFNGYLNKFDLSVHPYRAKGNLTQDNDTLALENLKAEIKHAGDSTYSKFLYFVTDKKGTAEYISILPITAHSDTIGHLVLKFSRKKYQENNAYLDILAEGENSALLNNSRHDYNYAIYINDALHTQSGEYPYPYTCEYTKIENDNISIIANEYSHLIYNNSPNQVIIVSNPKEPLIKSISIFSYIFSLFMIEGFLFLLFYEVIFQLKDNKESRLFSLSFRNRISFAMIALIIGTFTIIAIITIRYSSSEYQNFHRQQLIDNQKGISSSLEYSLSEDFDLSTATHQQEITSQIAELSIVHALDINIYDLSGNLRFSSQPKIYSNGLLSKTIQPDAFFDLSKNKSIRVLQEEYIGNLSYLAIYTPLRDKSGKTIAYLNLPYFDKEKNTSNGVTNFMATLLNIYTLLLIATGFIAFFVSKSITSPLAAIGEKLRLVTLHKKNETILWDTQDEIGALVHEYNRMISQLEQSAKLLARSERESAWREMAKQIAHEIKNPLTPMKLSIQHLQRAVKDNDESVPALASKVSTTLIEQIDNLTEIATAFSSFAKMPTAQNEVTDLKTILDTVVHLFQERKDVQLSYDSSLKNAPIFADKNQYISVFNNLVKNAIQAIDEGEKGKIVVSMIKENDFYKVSIQDNGLGIPENMQHKVFVPNFTTKSSGTGLGLAISKNIIENSGGSIWFKSIENEGTTFYVLIPFYKK